VKVEGEYIFDGPREEVWNLVRDPEVLITALPGAQSLEQVGENEYEGKMNVRVGPVAGLFSGRVVISNEVPPVSYTLTVEGRGAPGFVRGSGDVHLLDQGDGTTLIKYEGEVQIGGRLASVGQRLIDTASKSMTRQGLDALNKALQARVNKSEGQEVQYRPPSEVEFAAAVAKDMAGQMLSSPQASRILIALAVAVVIVIVVVAVILISSGR
jgi:carbon monoxide dehydrogenase subunit G